MEHVCAGPDARALFCAECGHVLDVESLRSIKFRGFAGPASLNPAIEKFWASGDPAGV